MNSMLDDRVRYLHTYAACRIWITFRMNVNFPCLQVKINRGVNTLQKYDKKLRKHCKIRLREPNGSFHAWRLQKTPNKSRQMIKLLGNLLDLAVPEGFGV
jgi:hypothetical protein